jgi:hypothetical protein
MNELTILALFFKVYNIGKSIYPHVNKSINYGVYYIDDNERRKKESSKA